MKHALQVGVMGPGESATKYDIDYAYQIGKLIAQKGWTLLSGGRKAGVMGAVNDGYHVAHGPLAVGISPTTDDDLMHPNLHFVASTNMRSGRNSINALSSEVMIAIGDLSSAGTLSEVAFKLIGSKPFEKKDNVSPFPVILFGKGPMIDALAQTYGDKVAIAESPEHAIEIIVRTMEKISA